MAGIRIYHICILLTTLKIYHHNFRIMAKKISKKSKRKPAPRQDRMTATLLTIQEGEEFVKAVAQRTLAKNRSVPKVSPKKTRLIKKPRAAPKAAPKAPKAWRPKPVKKVTKKIAMKPIKATKARKSPAKKGKSTGGKAPVSLFPVSTGMVPVPPARAGSRLSNNSKGGNKATKLKSSSRDDLQIPAFGFIDVCFCLDSTGSMGS